MNPTVLIVHSLGWPNAARLALAFDEAGCFVDALYQRNHPLRLVRSVRRTFTYNPYAPLRSLRTAIEQSDPDMIIPCDDWSVRLLHRLHRSNSDISPALRQRIERSLGDPAGYELVSARSRLPEMVISAAVPSPRTETLDGLAAFRQWLAREGLPAVVKAEHSTGGDGVGIVAVPDEVRSTFRRISRRQSIARALKRLVLDGDAEMACNLLWGVRSTVSAQRFVPGGNANCAVACWNGEVIAALAVEVVASVGQTGQSTVVRVVGHEGMLATARSVVRVLRMSGFCGLDFILEEGSGRAMLIEVNPRATQINHLALGHGRDLVGALWAKLADAPLRERPPVTDRDTIALFPQEVTRDPESKFLETAYHDMPTGAPELVRYYTGGASRRGLRLEPAD